MSTSRRAPRAGWQTIIPPTGGIHWSDEKFAHIEADGLERLLPKRGTKGTAGRLGPKESLDLALRIITRLPASAQRRRRLLASILKQFDAQGAARLHAFAADLRRGYSKSETGAPPDRPVASGKRRAHEGAPPRLFAEPVPSPLRTIDMTPPDSAGWRGGSHRRFSAQAAPRYAEAKQEYDSLLARVATRHTPRGS
jgi:hypothetical protein